MRKAVLLSLILILIPFSTSGAVAVKMQSLKTTSVIPLSSDPNDQVSALITSPNSIVVAGTTAGDGFLTSFDKSGLNIEWTLHLGGTSDDIATVITKDTSGNYWVAGATAIAPDSTPTALIPAGTLNPSGVILETSTASPALSQLDVWKVSSKGVLLKSYLTVMKSVILPQGISVKSGIVTVSGAIASQSSDHFTISLSAAGIFESPIITSMKNPSFAPSKDVKTTLSLWKSFTTSLAIKGLPTWKPKPNSHVLVRYDLKTKAIVAAYLSSSQILDFIWEKNIGIVALLSNSTGYGLAIIK